MYNEEMPLGNYGSYLGDAEEDATSIYDMLLPYAEKYGIKAGLCFLSGDSKKCLLDVAGEICANEVDVDPAICELAKQGVEQVFKGGGDNPPATSIGPEPESVIKDNYRKQLQEIMTAFNSSNFCELEEDKRAELLAMLQGFESTFRTYGMESDYNAAITALTTAGKLEVQGEKLVVSPAFCPTWKDKYGKPLAIGGAVGGVTGVVSYNTIAKKSIIKSILIGSGAMTLTTIILAKQQAKEVA